MKAWFRSACCLAVCISSTWAADWSSLYSEDKLQAEKPRLQQAVDLLRQKEIAPYLPPSSALMFGLQTIRLPLNGRLSDPLDFYSQGLDIVLPVRTLLFIEDLARAYGWLWVNRYTTATVDEYLGMLRFRQPTDFVDGRYPAPLSALHIPEDALADNRVVEMAVRARRTADTFLILHEFAHLELHHDARKSGTFTEVDEESADRYALDVMKNNSATPTGLLVVMYAELSLKGGEPEAQHPVTARRLDAMAHYMNDRVREFIRGRPDRATAMDGIFSISALLEEGSRWMTVNGRLNALREQALRTDVSRLQPRPLPRATK